MTQDISQATGPAESNQSAFTLRRRPGEPGYAAWLEARAAILADHLNIARHWAYRYARRSPGSGLGQSHADLLHAGQLALLAATEGFDPARGCPFRLYAHFAVRSAVRSEARSIDRLPLLVDRETAVLAGGTTTIGLDAISDRDLYARVAEVMARVLPAADRSLLVARYGLDGSEPRSLASLAAELGIRPQSVHGRERKALALLRAAFLGGTFVAA